MTVIYIDSVFALNAAADGFLLALTARLGGARPRRTRLALASLAGGAYAAAVYLPGWGFLADAPVKCAAGVGVALLAFGEEARLFRLTALFFALSCGYAGCVLALGLVWGGASAGPAGLYADGRVLAGAGVCVWAAASGLNRAASWRERRLLPVRVCVGGRTADLTALWDSGNGLRDGGRPVLVAAPDSLGDLLPPFLTAARLENPADLVEPVMRRAPDLRPRLAPYRAVGVASGLLLTVESEWTEIDGVRWPRLRLALSPTELGGGYQALWGGGAAGLAGVRKGDGKGEAYGHSGAVPEADGAIVRH